MAEFTWSTKEDWDNHDIYRSVATETFGVRSADEIALGLDPTNGVASDAVAFWHMDDTSGDLTDVVSGLDASTSSVTYGNAGPWGGNSVGFNPDNNSSASTGISSDPLGSGSFAVAVWIDRITGDGGDQTVVRTGDLEEGVISIVIDSSNNDTRVDYRDNDGGGSSVTFNENVYQGIVVISYDGSNNDFYLTRYGEDDSNGEIIEETVSQSSLIAESNADTLYIGNTYDGSKAVDGDIGFLALWNRHLSSDERSEICEAGYQGDIRVSPKETQNIQSIEIDASISDTVGEYGASFTSSDHDNTFSTSDDHGIVVSPNIDLEGIRVTIAENAGPSGYETAWISERSDPSTRLKEVDVSNVSNGEAIDINTPLTSGTDYVVYLTASTSMTVSQWSNADPPYDTDDFTIEGGKDDSSGSGYNLSFYQFDAVESILTAGEDEVTYGEAVVYQDSDDNGTWDLIERVDLLDGANTYDLTEFSESDSGPTTVRFEVETNDYLETPIINSATVTAERMGETLSGFGDAFGEGSGSGEGSLIRNGFGDAFSAASSTTEASIVANSSVSFVGSSAASEEVSRKSYHDGSLVAQTSSDAPATRSIYYSPLIQGSGGVKSNVIARSFSGGSVSASAITSASWFRRRNTASDAVSIGEARGVLNGVLGNLSASATTSPSTSVISRVSGEATSRGDMRGIPFLEFFNKRDIEAPFGLNYAANGQTYSPYQAEDNTLPLNKELKGLIAGYILEGEGNEETDTEGIIQIN